MENPKICLNMIVKDDSTDIIVNTLSNISNSDTNITYWVICDTGSTDNTASFNKKFFKDKNIKGECIHEPWKDFAYNRTKALELPLK